MDIEVLFNEHADDVYNFLVYFTRNPHAAEDLTQDTFAKAIESQHTFRGMNPRAWLLQIARNKAIDHYRKIKRESLVDIAILAVLPNASCAPDEIAESNDTLTRLLTAFSTLKPDFRDVIICRLIMDLSSLETAQTLGWTPNRVRVMLHRALQAVRKIENKEEWVDGLSR